MIPQSELRKFVLAVIKGRRELQFNTIQSLVVDLIQKAGLPGLSTNDQTNLNEVVWDLVIERVLTFGTESNSEARWPFVRLTEYGRELLSQEVPLHDPDGYVHEAKAVAAGMDSVVEQYLHEAAQCFRQGYLFAAAVMIGAADEHAILSVLEAISKAETSHSRKHKAEKLLKQPRLPEIFEVVLDAVKRASDSGAMPYSVHQGSATHLASFLEMIRVSRNDAVHPQVAAVSRSKLMLSLSSFPAALASLNALRTWFVNNNL